MRSLYIYLAGVVVILIAVVGVAYFATKGLSSDVASSTTETVATTTEAQTMGNYTIESVPLETLRDIMPSLTREVTFTGTIPESFKATVKEKIDAIRARLEKDETRANDWYDLAVWYHTANDYQGAKEVWEFLIKANSKDATAYDNLGKLYHYALKDFPTSESYFKKSIGVNSESLVPYIELFQLYSDSYKTDTTLAVETLESAAKKFPQEIDPLTLLGQYYRDKGETTKARDAYTRAMERARAANNIALIGAIGEELARLPQ